MIPKFTNNKVAVFTDLHLGVHSNSNQWHTIALDWAKWFINDVKQRGITDIVFCGDWHHNRSEISVDTLNVSAEILELFNQIDNLKLYMVTGNHDIYYKHRTDVHSLNIFKYRQNVHIIDKPYALNTNNQVVHFLPWGYNLTDLPVESKGGICFGHLEIVSFQMNSAKCCEEGFKVSELLNRYNLVMSGHFHIRYERKFNNGNILYVGNPFQMDFGDAGNNKGYYILDIDNLNYEFIENRLSPKYTKLLLSEMVSEGYISKKTINTITNNFVKCFIDKNISQDHLNILIANLDKLQPANLQINYDFTSNKILNNVEGHDFSGIDITKAIEEFVNILDIDNKENIIKYTLDLYKKCNQ